MFLDFIVFAACKEREILTATFPWYGFVGNVVGNARLTGPTGSTGCGDWQCLCGFTGGGLRAPVDARQASPRRWIGDRAWRAEARWVDGGWAGGTADEWGVWKCTVGAMSMMVVCPFRAFCGEGSDCWLGGGCGWFSLLAWLSCHWSVQRGRRGSGGNPWASFEEG